MSDRKKLLEKIAKLLKLGERSKNNSEAEAIAAFEKAKQLMAEHHISEAEVVSAEPAKVLQDYASKGAGHISRFDQWIASAASELAGVLVWKERRRDGLRLVFLGRTADVELAKATFEVFKKMVRALARTRCGKNAWSPRHRAWAEGFATELLRRARERAEGLSQEENSKCRALVLCKRDALQKYTPPLRAARKSTYGERHDQEFVDGVLHGRKVDLDPRKKLS